MPPGCPYGERLDVIADVLARLVLETPAECHRRSWLSAMPELLRQSLDWATHCQTHWPCAVTLDLFVKSAVAIWTRVQTRPSGGRTVSTACRQLRESLCGRSGYYAAPGIASQRKKALGHASAHGASTHAKAAGRARRGDSSGQSVREVLVEAARAVCVVTEKGERFGAFFRIELESETPVGALIDPAALPQDFRRHRALALRIRIPHERGLVGVPDFTVFRALLPSITPRYHHGTELLT